ncbi:unnamed protein product [Prunus armeniaca]
MGVGCITNILQIDPHEIDIEKDDCGYIGRGRRRPRDGVGGGVRDLIRIQLVKAPWEVHWRAIIPTTNFP